MSRLYGEKISYQDALNHYVGAFILIPAMLLGSYLLFMNFKAAEELAELKVKDSTEVIAQNISLSMIQLRSEIARLQSDRAAPDGGDERRMGVTPEQLEILVETNPYVTAAILRDSTGSSIIRFPASDLHLASTTINRTTKQIIAENPITDVAQLYMLEDLAPGAGELETVTPAEQFYFALPLSDSSANLWESVASVLWVRVNLQRFLDNASRPEWAAESRYSLSVSDNYLFESHSVSAHASDRIASSADLGIDVVRAGVQLPLRFSLSEYARLFTADARDFLVKGVLGLLAMGAILALLMKQFSAMLNRPLNQLISYSQHISHGEYEEAPKELVFDEFEQLRLAMTTMADKVQRSMEQLERFASTDFLTGLMNRRSFDDSGEREFERATRAADEEKTLWLIILDIDHFKRVNDTAGHTIGDLVIQSVATELASISRKSDIVGRLGGEEYGILLPEATRAGVNRVANEVLERVPQLVIDGWTKTGGPVTVSVGCACFDGKKDFDELYRIADEALYASKWNGRNRVSFEADVAANDAHGEQAPAADASNQ